MNNYIRNTVLSNEEINKIKRRKCIGFGTEANVYRVGNQTLYKLYRPYDELLEEFNYSDSNKIKSVYSDDNIRLAMERQPFVTRTSLPMYPLYDEDGKYIGCALKDHKLCAPIQSIVMLPYKRRVEILRNLLLSVKELCDNNIYHQDLVTKEIDGKSHSNVLVSLRGKPQIIDLDGKSTLYTTKKNEYYEYNSYVSLSALIMEILFYIDSSEDLDFYDMERVINNIVKYGVDRELSEKLVSLECEYDDLQLILK